MNELVLKKLDVAEFNERTPLASGSGFASAAIKLHKVYKVGNEIITIMDIDLDEGIACGGAGGDALGTDGGAANAYIMELSADVNGLPVKAEMTCIETPAGGDPDINLSSSATGTTAENAALTSGTDILDNGDLAAGFFNEAGIGDTVAAGAIAKKYLYLTCGTATEAAYTAGKIRVKITGLAETF